MKKYFYRRFEVPGYTVWISWFELQNDNVTIPPEVTIRPEVFDTRKEAVAQVKELIAEDRSKGHESEYLR